MGQSHVRILMVFTSHDQLGNTGRPTRFWLEEGSAPYIIFRDAGVDLTLAGAFNEQRKSRAEEL